MQIRLLGAHQGDSLHARFMSILVDGVLAIDAGGLTSALTEEEQIAIEAVLITHRHFDHIKDLPGLAHTRWLHRALDLYCIADTREAIRAHVFNDVVWPALREKAGPYHPVRYHEMRPGEPREVAGYSVLPIEVSHTVPAAGYLVARGGKSFFYTADTRGTGAPPWAGIRPDLLLAETTMASAHEAEAFGFGHMTPLSLEQELRAFHAAQGYYPRTVCVHINPAHRPAIEAELRDLAARTGADVRAGREGMVLEL